MVIVSGSRSIPCAGRRQRFIADRCDEGLRLLERRVLRGPSNHSGCVVGATVQSHEQQWIDRAEAAKPRRLLDAADVHALPRTAPARGAAGEAALPFSSAYARASGRANRERQASSCGLRLTPFTTHSAKCSQLFDHRR